MSAFRSYGTSTIKSPITMEIEHDNVPPWNKSRIIGQKRPLQISHIWGIRIRLELEGKVRDLALFNMALDGKLRGCDLVKLKVSDVVYGHSVSGRAALLQKKTGSSVQFELT